jgi:hypothetical protein
MSSHVARVCKEWMNHMVRLQLTTNSLILRTKDVGRERNVLAGSLEDK